MNSRLLILSVCCIITSTLFSQTVTSIDLVKVPQAYEKEALYFYEQNWKKFREAALDEGIISGFQLLRSELDSTAHFMLMLITEYVDSTSFNAREENFRPLMKRIAPNGPALLNDIPRSRFAHVIMGWDMETLFRQKIR